jgi:hypothetical protein
MSSERDSFAKGIFSTFARGFLLHKLLLKVNYSPLRVKKSRSHDMGHYWWKSQLTQKVVNLNRTECYLQCILYWWLRIRSNVWPQICLRLYGTSYPEPPEQLQYTAAVDFAYCTCLRAYFRRRTIAKLKKTRLKRLPVISREYFHEFVYFYLLFKKKKLNFKKKIKKF